MAGIVLRGLTKRFGATEVIRGVDLTLAEGRLTVFVGPSGCGKSTLLRLIAGLEEPTAGEILIGGEPVTHLPPAKRGIAMVFQSYALYPHMSVYDNMAFGLKLARLGGQAVREKVQRAAAILQIGHLLDRKPRELSGGQRQRVAIGRAIVREPKVFLFDEPLSNLDAALRVQMRLELARLQRDLSATMVYVTHDQVEAMTLGHHIVVLNRGRVEQSGTPMELYHYPRNLFVAGFIGSPTMNLLPGTVEAVAADTLEVNVSGLGRLHLPVESTGLEAGQKVTLGIRPEHLHPGEDERYLRATVTVAERLGSETYLHVRTADETLLTVKAEGDTPVGTGDEISVGFARRDIHLFDEHGQALARRELPEKSA